eukprot:scaffold8567_cov277-Pinguiococcus_pyrenoidosus.AAC.6
MCKHILNAQVSVRAACCKRWFDCPECHEEQEDHPWQIGERMVWDDGRGASVRKEVGRQLRLSCSSFLLQALACKVCKKAFWKDLRQRKTVFCVSSAIVFLTADNACDRIFSDGDEYCPHCHNKFVLPAVTPESIAMEEGQRYIDAFCKDLLERKG